MGQNLLGLLLTDMKVGLYTLVEKEGEEPLEEGLVGRVVNMEEQRIPFYGPLPGPKEEDYFTCPRCGEEHVLPCAEVPEPPKPSFITVRRYYVELQGAGYQRYLLKEGDWKLGSAGRLDAPAMTWKNDSKEDWQVDGYFLTVPSRGGIYMQPIQGGPTNVKQGYSVTLDTLTIYFK